MNLSSIKNYIFRQRILLAYLLVKNDQSKENRNRRKNKTGFSNGDEFKFKANVNGLDGCVLRVTYFGITICVLL